MVDGTETWRTTTVSLLVWPGVCYGKFFMAFGVDHFSDCTLKGTPLVGPSVTAAKEMLTVGNSLYCTLGTLLHCAPPGDFRFPYCLGSHCVCLRLLVPPW